MSPPPPTTARFEAVYAEWFDYVWLLLRRFGVREADLEDAAQEVFIAVHRRLAEYDPARPMRAWLSGFAWRVAMRERRRPRNQRESLPGPESFEQRLRDEAHPERALAAAQRRARVHAALDALDDKQRPIFVMHALQGMPCPEIAEVLGVPVNTVYTRLRAGRAGFRAALGRLRLAGGEA